MLDLFEDQATTAQVLREYQENAVSKVIADWQTHRRVLIVMATGGGKTTVIAEVVRRAVDPRIHRVLVVAHAEELIGQLYERISQQFDGQLRYHFTDRYQPGIGRVGAGFKAYNARIVVGMRQALSARRMEEILAHGAFDFVIIDEAHHLTPTNTYNGILQACERLNPNVKVLGATATPKRQDGKALGAIFDKVSDTWSIETGIKSRMLVPARRIRVNTGVDLTGVKKQAGDYAADKLTSVLKAQNWVDVCLDAWHKFAQPLNRPMMAFFPAIAMSEEFTAALNAEGTPAAHIDGETDKAERRRVLHDYRDGKLQVISNMSVLTEGVDLPRCAGIFMARPTQSESLYIQMVGRGLRLYPGKEDCVIIDLAPTDDRALMPDDILGKMKACEACGVESWAGIAQCPACGHMLIASPKKKLDGDEDDALESGGGTGEPDTILKIEGVSYDIMFASAASAWYSENGQVYSCGIGDHGTLIIMPPSGESESYTLWRVPKKGDPVLIERNADLASLFIRAEHEVKQFAGGLALRNAHWRQQIATVAQMQMLASLSNKPRRVTNRGEASQIITHLLATRQLARYMQGKSK